MGEQTGGRPADRGHRFTDRGKRFTDRGQDLARRRFLGKQAWRRLPSAPGSSWRAAPSTMAPTRGYGTGQANGTGQSSTSGQNATSGQGGSQGKDDKSQGSSGSQSGMSS
jgi:hypothetical protein